MDLTFTPMALPGEARNLKIPPTAMSPLHACASAEGFRSYGGRGQWFLAAFEMPWKGPAHDAAALHVHVQERLGRSGVQLHDFLWSSRDFVYGTALVDGNGLQALEDAAAAGRLARFEVALIPNAASAPTPVPLAPAPGKTPLPQCQEPTLYGVIDSGCPMAQRRLRSRQGTRVLQFWDQEGVLTIPGAAPPLPWGFGRAADAAAIDSYFGAVAAADDWAAYRNAGLPGLALDASHGSHLLGCLFGAHANATLLWTGVRDHVPLPHAERTPEGPDLVFVQLPSAYLQGVSNGALGIYRITGLCHILACAGPQTRQVIVPVASENYDGSHDGQSLYDACVDALVKFAREKLHVEMTLLVSAGNCLRSNIHQCVTIGPRTSGRFSLRVPPGNERETYVELWLPHALEGLEFALQAPHATGAPTFVSGDGAWSIEDPLGRQVGTMASLRQPTQAGGSQRAVAILLAPTHGSGSTGIAGDWVITVRVPAGTVPVPAGEVLGYIGRTTPGPGGRRRGYQATFVRRFSQDWDFQGDCPAGASRPYDPFSLSGLATTTSVKAIGGYCTRAGERATYSAGGPARAPGRISEFLVDAGAPSDESRNAAGILGWGNRAAGFVRFSGTSVAAPLAARSVGVLGALKVGKGKGRKDPPIAIADILL